VNSEQQLARSERSHVRGLNRLQTFLQERLVGTVAVSILLNLGLTGAATWNVWSASQNLKSTVTNQTRLQEITSSLTYLDAAFEENTLFIPGKQLWEKRYKDNTFDVRKVTTAVLTDLPPEMKSVFVQVESSGRKIMAIEGRVFSLVKEKKLPEASAIMRDKEYRQERGLYIQSVETIVASIKERVNSQIQTDRQSLDRSIFLAIISLGLLAATGGGIVIAIQGYIRDREAAQQSLQAFQSNLLQLNEQLQQEVQLRAVQQEQIAKESETLQNDVGHILDVVCSLEEGNLTVQAEVNERATGLVSDTLNRLTESLHGIISTVVSSAYQVTDSANGLEHLAIETARQAQTQTRSIQQIEELIDRVNLLTDNSYQQALATTDAVTSAKVAVGVGQQEMSAMVDGIGTLQEGTEQIVKRVQILNQFVELAAQFSKDQKRVAALTRVLALNASLLSTRAISEQDPTQFASLANEFKTIADRVNDLATDTNTSLVTLQQRTNQIQTVTSGLNQDVSEIEQLVQKFTTEVNNSRQAFANIQAVTDGVATMGLQVSTSSQEVVKVVSDTLSAIQSIDIIAQDTEDKATTTRESVRSMGSLAQVLLQMVGIFQLQPVSTVAETDSLAPTSVETDSNKPALAYHS
jgi:methyl-accepting chemotaxis protein PixJ